MKKILLIYLLCMLFIPSRSYAIRALPEDNLAYPVLIELPDKSKASGFYLNSGDKYYFVTAKHVLFNVPPSKIYKKGIAFPEEKKVPNISMGKLCYNKCDKTLIYEGQMSKEELSILPDWAPDDALKNAVREIYEKSHYKLKGDTAILSSYTPEIDNPEKNVIEIPLKTLLETGEIKYSEAHDIAIVEIGEVIKENNKQKIKFGKNIKIIKKTEEGFLSVSVDSLKKYEDILVGNEIYVFGYPTSLGLKHIPQIDYEKPLLRKGIIAGTNDKLKTIILDCPLYFGNSGGPVVEVEEVPSKEIKFKVIGLVSQQIPFVEEWYNIKQGYSNIEISNSGYSVAVPTDFLLELVRKN